MIHKTTLSQVRLDAGIKSLWNGISNKAHKAIKTKHPDCHIPEPDFLYSFNGQGEIRLQVETFTFSLHVPKGAWSLT